MKRVFGMVEAAFDVCYLVSGIIMGVVLLIGHDSFSLHTFAGVMALTLIVGDAFHLIPRIQTVLTGEEEKMRKALGIGKLVTSVTMTVFYLFLWEIGKALFTAENITALNIVIYILAICRIGLCFLPQNRWTERYPPVSFGIIRNVPFFIMGVLVAAFYFHFNVEILSLQWMWLAIVLSFAFYLPVVVWANKNPKIGMLMLPKTCMYVWILIMFLRL